MTSPLTRYRHRVDSGKISADPHQMPAIEALQDVYAALVNEGPRHRGWRRYLARLSGNAFTPTRGVYLWGGVGRGKTFLMDLFYDCLPFEDKVREHFHRFMGGVHDTLTEFRARPNPLKLTADRIAGQTRVICFDEFFVSDIADAMILSNLFEALFDRGMTLVATSNTRPDDLYRGGLQRQRFLSAISLIKKHTRVVELGGLLDYRLRVLERADVYQEPTGGIADQKLSECFEAIAPDEGERNLHIEILGRKIEARRAADGVVWFDFPQICDGPRSQNDYIELSRCYQTVVISNVPKLTKELEDQARRFVALVDEFYDRRVKLILSAATTLSSLYTGERLQLEFQRTRSRLEEMQSHDYLASPHIP